MPRFRYLSAHQRRPWIGIRTIQGVDTSTTAFVGRTLRGPVNVPQAIQSFADFEEQFGGLWNESPVSFAVRDFFFNGGKRAVVVRLYRPSPSPLVASRAQLELGGPPGPLLLEAASPGAWGNHLRVRTSHSAGDPARFDIAIRDTATGATERFPELSLDPNDTRFITTMLAIKSDLVRVVGSLPENLPPEDTPAPASADPFAPSTSTGVSRTASDGEEPTAADYLGSQAQETGLYALEDADLFNLLCLPMRGPQHAQVYPDVVNAAINYCEQKRAIFLMDPLPGWSDPQSTIAGIDAFSHKSRNAAVFYPLLHQNNPLANSHVETFPPCGAVAGIIARTDAAHGPWKAPAGRSSTIKGITGLSRNLSNADNNQLNRRGVNCLRTFPGIGSVIWGGRTLAGDDRLNSQWKYLSVVRTSFFIEESLTRGTQWTLASENGTALWQQLGTQVESFMNDLFRKGAFRGRTPREAYFVRCNASTTTTRDVQNGLVNIEVGFAPLKPAEFIILRIQQRTQG